MRTIRIGTRGSTLALAQAEIVHLALAKLMPGVKIDIVPIRTAGDILSEAPLDAIGGKGVFVKDIEKRLLQHDIDLAVHSLKDMQAILPETLMIGAYLQREDPRDMLFAAGDFTLETLPESSRVGTSSLRRKCQLKAMRPDLIPIDIRGNVSTRLKKVGTVVDAVILAASGIIRQGLPLGTAIDPCMMIPSPGQGIISIECRADDEEILRVLRRLDHAETRICAEAERSFLLTLGQDCRLPAGALAKVSGDFISMEGMLGSCDENGTHKMKIVGTSPLIGTILAEYLLERIMNGSM